MQLNPQQQHAVDHVDGPLLVLAGAGCGKTRVVTARIAKLLSIGVLPSDILAVTFTNKAAKEMQQRVKKLTNANILACTFHSLGARILREIINEMGYSNNFAIYDEEDSLKLIKNCFASLGMKDDKGLVKTVKMLISQTKNNLMTIEEADTKEEKAFHAIFPMYQARLKEYNAVDFDDLLYLPIKIFQKNETLKKEYQERWLFILVDEYQDTNMAQYNLIKILSNNHQNLFVVGDPDQSIYSWRGARYQNILDFDKDFKNAKVVKLEHNYRSTNKILLASNSLINHNNKRLEKNLFSTLDEGENVKIFLAETADQEVHFIVQKILSHYVNDKISYDEMVVFYRTNAQSRIFEEGLLKNKIPYIVYGGISFYERKEIKDLISFLRLLISDTDFLSFTRTLMLFKNGIGTKTIEKISSYISEEKILLNELCNHKKQLGLSDAQYTELCKHINILLSLRELKKNKIPISKIISEIITRFHYLEHLKEEPDSFDDRLENIQEFIAKAFEWENENEDSSLEKFLEEITLIPKENKKDGSFVKLMTLHNGKGLEFSLVFIAGMEEDIFPHISSRDSIEELEEERRLCYVGMTRAKKLLYMTASSYRYLWGETKIMQPSRFLAEIDRKYVNFISTDRNHEPNKEEVSSFSEEISLAVGMKVKHKTFGIGIIKKISSSSMGDIYDVYFSEDKITRTLAAKYAKLSKC
jgi:DNA helicase-2/ATP-dependent DNA helicase PcrA